MKRKSEGQGGEKDRSRRRSRYREGVGEGAQRDRGAKLDSRRRSLDTKMKQIRKRCLKHLGHVKMSAPGSEGHRLEAGGGGGIEDLGFWNHSSARGIVAGKSLERRARCDDGLCHVAAPLHRLPVLLEPANGFTANRPPSASSRSRGGASK